MVRRRSTHRRRATRKRHTRRHRGGGPGGGAGPRSYEQVKKNWGHQFASTFPGAPKPASGTKRGGGGISHIPDKTFMEIVENNKKAADAKK